jgi:enterochelin esterase-like enzyme
MSLSSIRPQIQPSFPFPPELIESPHLVALEAEIAHDPKAEARFWNELASQATPLIEPHPHDHDFCIVSFVWRDLGFETEAVLLLIATVTDYYRHQGDISPHLMRRMPNSAIWHLSLAMRNDFRSSYQFYSFDSQRSEIQASNCTERELWLKLLENTQPDPLNPEQLPSLRDWNPHSILALPKARPETWWTRRPDVPAGSFMIESFRSELLNNERNLSIYLPHGYNPEAGPYPLLIMFDGNVWGEKYSIAPTLDNLIAEGRIPPMIALMPSVINNQIRGEELPCNPKFIDFVSQELIPWAAQRWNISDRAERTIVAGQSYGGLAASFAAFYAPERFGNVLSQSGSFWWPDFEGAKPESRWMLAQYEQNERRAVRFYLEVGLCEWMLLSDNYTMRDILEAKGYDLHFAEFNGGHDYIVWRSGIAEGLIALTASWSDDGL